jgi:transposase-like protein
MTDDRLPLAELLAKAGDGDFLRSVAEAVLQMLMEADVEGLIGAGRHERTGERLNYRNGFRVLGATWQRCRVHWMRNALAHVGKAQQSMASAALRQAFLQPDQAGARQTWRHVADQLRPRWPKLGKLMDDSEDDVLAYMAFPAQHRTKLHSVNTLERLNKEVKRRADVVGIFPSEASIIRLIGAVLLEANDEWQMQHRYMGVEAMGEMLNPPPTIETLQLPPKAA